MMRNLKGLGLALVAVVALSAVAANSALAAFESGNAGVTTLTPSANGTQTFKYAAFSLTVSCSTVGGSGSVSGTFTEEAEFSPTYSGCSTSLGQSADVKMNGCKYVFTSAKGVTAATVHIACVASNKIEITITEPTGTSICTYTIGSQTPAGNVALTTTGVGTTRELDMSSALNGIVGERDGSAICGAANSAGGTYSGEMTATGESAGVHVGIWTD